MTVTIKSVNEAFEFLFSALVDKKFTKTLRLDEWSERELLPLVRTFLLGYFGESIVPEAISSLPGSLTGNGRIDFIVDNVAVELAVNNRGQTTVYRYLLSENRGLSPIIRARLT
jgi:hypothetical protein